MKHTLRLLLLALLTVLCSCEYKDLCYDHSHVVDLRVNYDWSQVANPDEANPDGMSAYFYGGNDQTTRGYYYGNRYDIPGKFGGNIRIEWGDYQVLGYNYDTEAILFRGTESIETYEAYTRLSSLEEGTQLQSRSGVVEMPRAAGTDSQPVVLEPDMLWAGTGEEDLNLVIGQENATVTIHPQQRVIHVTIILENVPNLQYTSQFGGSLSGLAGGVYLASGRLNNELVIQSFPISKIGDNTLKAEFNAFGHCPEADHGVANTHVLTIYAILADGSKWYFTEDVTDQIHDPQQNPDQYNIILHISDLPVPKPIVNGSGFKPQVDGWDHEEIEVGM